MARQGEVIPREGSERRRKLNKWTAWTQSVFTVTSLSCRARGSNPGPPNIVILQWPLPHKRTALLFHRISTRHVWRNGETAQTLLIILHPALATRRAFYFIAQAGLSVYLGYINIMRTYNSRSKNMSASGISLYSRPRARRSRARYKVKFPGVPSTFRSRITSTKIYSTNSNF